MIKEKLPAIGRALSLILLLSTVGVILTAFIRSREKARPTSKFQPPAALKRNVVSVIEGYTYVANEKGRENFRINAAKDTTYDDGKHELDKVVLISTDEKDAKKKSRIVADKGTYEPAVGIVIFEGNVKAVSGDGLNIETQKMRYDQNTGVATTDQPVKFRNNEMNGSSVGAELASKEHQLKLHKDVYILSRSAGPLPGPLSGKTQPNAAKSAPPHGGGPPVEIWSTSAEYYELQGIFKFLGYPKVKQGDRMSGAENMTGFLNLATKKIERIELRTNSFLKSEEKSKMSSINSRDMDFFFDEKEQLKSAIAIGAAYARSLENDSPREMSAERIEAQYKSSNIPEKGNILQSVSTQGRTTIKIEAVDSASRNINKRVLEADSTVTLFQEDGKNMLRSEAMGNAIITITPMKITANSEKRELRANKIDADFLATENKLKTVVADGNAVANFTPLEKKSRKTKKMLSGRKMTSNMNEYTQDIADLRVEGDAKLKDGDRNGSSVRADYNASTGIVAMRGKPMVWDSVSRAKADEIDANIDSGESFLRRNVRSTYYDNKSTGGAMPFKDKKAPINIASDKAVVQHDEATALYQGNVRAWQENDFIRSENMELDKGEQMMTAWGNAQSAFYDFERDVDKSGNNKKKEKEVVPVFGQADKIIYREDIRTAHYEGSVKIRQGIDRIDSSIADVILDENHQLFQMIAVNNVVMTQPGRIAKGNRVIYTAPNDTAVLTGEPAIVDDREREATTKSVKLTLHLHDARIEAHDDGTAVKGIKNRVKTTHRIKN